MVGLLVGWLVAWLAGWFVDWLLGWLAGWLKWDSHGLEVLKDDQWHDNMQQSVVGW